MPSLVLESKTSGTTAVSQRTPLGEDANDTVMSYCGQLWSIHQDGAGARFILAPTSYAGRRTTVSCLADICRGALYCETPTVWCECMAATRWGCSVHASWIGLMCDPWGSSLQQVSIVYIREGTHGRFLVASIPPFFRAIH